MTPELKAADEPVCTCHKFWPQEQRRYDDWTATCEVHGTSGRPPEAVKEKL